MLDSQAQELSEFGSLAALDAEGFAKEAKLRMRCVRHKRRAFYGLTREVRLVS
jgi:hypothetical protein